MQTLVCSSHWITAVLVFLVVGLLTLRIIRSPKNLPPLVSPWFTLRFLASAILGGGVTAAIIKHKDDLSAEISRCGLGFRNHFIFLNTHEAVKEVFSKTGEDIAGRPKFMKLVSNGLGVLGSEGRIWREHRRFSLNTLRDFGMGKIAMEDKVLGEALVAVKELARLDGKSFDVWRTLGIVISNVISSVVFGRTFEHDDPTCDLFLNTFNQNAQGSWRRSVLISFPFLRHVPRDPLGFYEFRNCRDKVDELIVGSFEEHRKDFDENNVRDVIDAYLVEMTRQQEKDTDTTFTVPQMTRLVFDLFSAGSETTATTLRWALMMMILHPQIQSRVQEEIDDVIGGEGLVKMAHRQRMLYTECVLMEVQRFASLVVMVPHRAMKDVNILGYTIPEDAMVVANLWRLHRDEKIWPNPDKFDPNNFLDENNEIIRREHLVPFAVGKRQCLGEGMAKMELFIFFVTFLQRFTFSVPEGHTPPSSDEYIVGIVRGPKRFLMNAVKR
ncbi:cytochrome P450 2C15-like [Lineus longissimus]|uniref:cytochrome P450 2C15-like n=1 Tax=Lineus longissimus TaxID=88925 RepID=UPI002B4C2B88